MELSLRKAVVLSISEMLYGKYALKEVSLVLVYALLAQWPAPFRRMSCSGLFVFPTIPLTI